MNAQEQEKQNFTANQTGSSPRSGSPNEPEIRAPFRFFVFDFLKVFVIALAIIIPVRLFLFQPFVVTGDSMQPNFVDGDYLIIDEVTYRFREPDRGEVVVLRFVNDRSKFFIKRIIGLPGDRIVVQNGEVSLIKPGTGERAVLQEDYLPLASETFGNVDVVLKEDEYFVLGDNRLSSSDSRLWGPLPRQLIVGRVVLRALPLSSFEFFSSPEYTFIEP